MLFMYCFCEEKMETPSQKWMYYVLSCEKSINLISHYIMNQALQINDILVQVVFLSVCFFVNVFYGYKLF